MPNGKEIINELNYRQLIENMPAKELRQFTALRTYENSITLGKHEIRLDSIEAKLPGQPSRKRKAAFGGTVFTAITAIFYTVGRQLGWWQ